LSDYCARVKPLLSLTDVSLDHNFKDWISYSSYYNFELQHIQKVMTDFEKQWESGTFPGWPVCHLFINSFDLIIDWLLIDLFYWFIDLKQKETGSALAHSGAHLDLSAFTSWEELASLGLDRLKSALMALGLKCGGFVSFINTNSKSFLLNVLFF
jgi:hypothetical protein